MVDKFTFFISVPLICLDFFILGKYPDDLTYNFHLFIVLGLIGWRHINYGYNKYHYYLIDFCYYGNYTICLMLAFYPTNRWLYIASFSFSCGTLGMATILVKNSFVLHNIDRMTSLYIHLKPLITLTNLHWSTQYSKNRGWDLYDPSGDEFSFEFFIFFFKCTFSIYFTWAVIYYVIIFIVRRKKIKERNYDTLFKYLASTDKGARKLWYSRGKKYAGVMFMLTHIGIQLGLTCLAFLCYFSIYLNILVVCTTLTFNTWRRAGFYMDYFCKKYEINLSLIHI